MSNTVISVENLTKRYDLGVIGTGTLSRDLNRWWARLRHQPDPYTKIGQEDSFKRIGESILALDDVSFTVQQGEALGIIGRNGAGKSTLLKILSRVTAPTSGVVKVKGRIGSLLEVGTGFHPELTGRENIYLNGAILGMRKDEVQKKFDEIVDFSGVEKFIDTPVKRYSSGMYVRLAFAVAAHLDPEILVVDEVLAVGDAEFQKKCLGKMGDVASAGRTVLFVSHNMVSINSLCQRGVYLKNGSIKYDDTAKNVINFYLDDLELSAAKGPSPKSYRYGMGSVHLVDVEIFSRDKKVTTLTIGEPVTFNFLLSNITANTNCIFTIYDQYSQAIATMNSANQNSRDLALSNSKNSFTCEINRLTLYPGRYRLNVAIYVNNKLNDHIEGAAVFDVKPGLINGRLIHQNDYAKVYLDHIWKIPR
jgi:lipopolysaccharide transport system ATP-binding protein